MKTPLSHISYEDFCRSDIRCLFLGCDAMELFRDLCYWEDYVIAQRKRLPVNDYLLFRSGFCKGYFFSPADGFLELVFPN